MASPRAVERRTRSYGLVLEYDGTDFKGSQLQAGARTVQGELEAALNRIFKSSVRVRMSGRTDAGVHATGQVAAFEAEGRLDQDSLRRALNYYLPEDLKIRCAAGVPERFDPRRRARSRTYRYLLNDGLSPPALFRRTETYIEARLDAEAMHAAASVFKGTHDFAGFSGPAVPKDASTVREVVGVHVERNGDRVSVTVEGNAFLHQQVRRMVAGLVEVGLGHLKAEELQKGLEAPGRKRNAKVLGPEGLCLVSVRYDDAGPCGLPEMKV